MWPVVAVAVGFLLGAIVAIGLVLRRRLRVRFELDASRDDSSRE